ncbi:MAG: hypothetical protein ABWZ25_00010 [Chitinophagaceae bacterium]
MPSSLHIINNLFEMQVKVRDAGGPESLERNFTRLFNLFEEDGFVVQDPTGESYTDTRTDCEASISGRLGSKLTITRTIKPVIYQRVDNKMQLLQKAVVIVESK